MIRCSGVTKSYGEGDVLDSFSYTFGDAGFYLLLGESGSGKTTLLNVVSGMIPFDSGEIEVCGRKFSGAVDMDAAGCGSDYITQDTFFVDFLTVGENLRLIRDDGAKVEDVLARVGLGGKEEMHPPELSGGERGRLAMARALMTDGRVLFLDEPTASLDAENKRAVFSLIREISASRLVICSSHDAEAEAYADRVIRLEKGAHGGCAHDDACNASQHTVRRAKKRREVKKRPMRELWPFLKKWSSSKGRAFAPDICFCVFLTLALCLLMIADTPRRKLDANAENLYRINVVKVRTENDRAEDYALLDGLDGVRDIIPEYGSLLPDLGGEYDPDTGVFEGTEEVEYELTDQHALPGEAALFPFSDRIEYGTYFTGKDQMIITDAYARYLCPGSPGDAVGRTFVKNLYGLGETELSVVGVLGPMDDFEYRYFQVAGGGVADLFSEYDAAVSETKTHEDEFYINGDLFDEYARSEYFGVGARRSYYLYFDGYRETVEFLEKNAELFEARGFYGIPFADREFVMPVFEGLSYILLPLSALITLLSVVFYAFIVKTELAYNNGFVSAFNYAGFTVMQAVRGLVRLNLRRLFVAFAVSGACAAAISVGLNLLNRRFAFVPFELFTYNVPLLFASAATVAVSAAAAVNFFLRRLKYKSWYENLIANRDLL